MTTEARFVLDAFDALKPAERQQVAIEILRRSEGGEDLAGGAIDDLAAAVFRDYDAEEADGADD
jgi:hypothetical protein